MSKALIGNFKGPKGDKGDKGDVGAQGPRGEQGPVGLVNSGGIIEFEDYESGGEPGTDEALSNIKSGKSLREIISNIKAFCKGVVTFSKVLVTMEEVSANTSPNMIASATVLKELNNKMLVKSNSVALACYFSKTSGHDRVYSASHYYPYGVISAKVTGVEIPWVKFLSASEVAKIQVIASGNYFYFQCDDAGVVSQIGNKTCVVTMKIS